MFLTMSSSFCLSNLRIIATRRDPGIAKILGFSKLHMGSALYDSKNDGNPKKPPELDSYPGKEFTNAWQIKQKGRIYDKKPFKHACIKDKVYMWCACGLSKNQPFCDGSHKGPLMKSVLKPVTFVAPESKDYWFCNCKQTNHRPLCDGTHRNQEIQDAVKS